MKSNMADTGVVWRKSLSFLPEISYPNVLEHLKGCGKKNIGEKGYKFFAEAYIHDVHVAKMPGSIHTTKVKAQCYRSQRKTESPHSMELEVGTEDKKTKIIKAKCSCKAGNGGHCNHLFGLLYTLNHWFMLNLNEIPADKTCTSMPQTWHKPRGPQIQPEPVMSCFFACADTDKKGERKKPPVHCKIYDARSTELKGEGWNRETVFKECSQLSNRDKKPPASYLLLDQEPTNLINTAIGNVPIGSYLGYQFFDENNEEIQFVFDRREENIRSESDVLKYVKPFPSLPVGAIDNIPFVPPENLTPEEVRVLSSITLTLERAQELFDKTVGQSLLPEWFEARKKRLTASNFGAVLHRKKKPTESFLQSIFDPKDLSNVESIRHGRQNELKAQAIYACEMQKKNRKFTVFEAGLAVNPSLPFLGATPDAKVFDPTEKEPFGLLEIKCPFTWRDMTFEDACQDPKFTCEIVDGKYCLKKNHKAGYYAQVQGQLALSKARWCDFAVYLTVSKEMNVQRVYFDEAYCDQVLPKLKDFYFRHALQFLV